MSKIILNFTTEIKTDWGHTTFFFNGFSFDYFFVAEKILRKMAKFEYRWLFLSELTAAFEKYDDLDIVNRNFIYKKSKLVLFHHFDDLYIFPQAKQNATKEDNDNVIEISNLLIQELNKLTTNPKS